MSYPGLPNFLSFHSGGNTGLTVAQSASSSSAITAGSVVNVPCPISAAGETMVIVPSVEIVSQTFGDSAASAFAVPDGSSTPKIASGSGVTVSARVRPAAALRKSRRLRSDVRGSMRSVMAQPSREARWIALMIFR